MRPRTRKENNEKLKNNKRTINFPLCLSLSEKDKIIKMKKIFLFAHLKVLKEKEGIKKRNILTYLSHI